MGDACFPELQLQVVHGFMAKSFWHYVVASKKVVCCMDILINGEVISVPFKSDAVVARRVAAHIERRLDDNDWRPYRTKDEAIAAWSKLGGLRAAVLRAYKLIP